MMRRKHVLFFACAALTVSLFTSCNLKDKLKSLIEEKTGDKVEAKTDSLLSITITETVSLENDKQETVSDEEAIAFIEEFYTMDGWDVSDLKKYLSPEALKAIELDPDDETFRDVAIGDKYMGWELVCGDPVGDLDLLNTTKAKAIGNNQYEKVFTVAHWMDHSHKQNVTYRYTVGRRDGQLKITKVERGV